MRVECSQLGGAGGAQSLYTNSWLSNSLLLLEVVQDGSHSPNAVLSGRCGGIQNMRSTINDSRIEGISIRRAKKAGFLLSARVYFNSLSDRKIKNMQTMYINCI